MGSTKHEKSFVDYDRPYEQNLIGMRGIIYFGIGLFLLIVVTFALMWVLLNVMEDNAKQTKDIRSPMAPSEREKLPPEPRLQAAPGYGVETGQGWVNLELSAPQAEYRVLEREWENLLKNGQRDQQTNTQVTLPIDEAKRRLIQANPKARSGPEAEKAFEDTKTMVSYPSSGRLEMWRRR